MRFQSRGESRDEGFSRYFSRNIFETHSFFYSFFLDKRFQSRGESRNGGFSRNFSRNFFVTHSIFGSFFLDMRFQSRWGEVGTEDFREIFSKLTHFWIPFSWTRDSKVEGE